MSRIYPAILFGLAILLTAVSAGAKTQAFRIIDDLGINGEDLADTPVTDVISLYGPQGWATEVLLIWSVTPGDSEDVAVSCQESTDGTVWGWIPHCTDASPAVCTKGRATYEIDGAITVWETLVKARAPRLRCYLDDPADGTGSVASASASILTP